MVSPMRRTLETTYHCFKNHPNFSKLTIVVNPWIREKFTVTCDIPLTNAEFLDEFQNKYQPMFDGKLTLMPEFT